VKGELTKSNKEHPPRWNVDNGKGDGKENFTQVRIQGGGHQGEKEAQQRFFCLSTNGNPPGQHNNIQQRGGTFINDWEREITRERLRSNSTTISWDSCPTMA